MNRKLIAICAGVGLAFSAVMLAKLKATVAPGFRIQVLAHNAYPDHGEYADRLDRAIAAGVPFAVEEDLAWIDGRSLLIHGAKNVSVDDPTLENYFFPKVAPIMEQAVKDGNKGNWPLVTLNLDIKNDPPEHLAAISKVLDQHNAWLTTAVKSSDVMKQAPLDVRPQHLPREKKQEAIDLLATRDPEQLLTKKADNYRRWMGVNWAFIEKGGQPRADAWNSAQEERLKKFTDYGHRLG